MTLPVSRTPYLITSREFSAEDPLKIELIKSYSEIARAVNERTVGIFDKFLLVTGNRWFNNDEPTERRQEYRQVYEFNNQSATFSISHGLTNIDFLTGFYGSSVTATNFIPLPFVGVTANTSIEINIDSTNINIIFDSASPALTKGVIVVNYIQVT